MSTPMHRCTPRRALGAILCTTVLAGCASFSPDGGFSAIEAASRTHLDKEVRWVRSETDADGVSAVVQKLLAEPLSADAAVQIALINNRGLQAAYGQLGIAEADLVQAGRLRNPVFSWGRFTRGDEVEIERGIVFDVFGLLLLPARMEVAGAQFERTKLQVAGQVMQIAAQTRRAYFNALAAREAVRYLEQARDAAQTSAELARRMVAAGNFSRLDQAREQAFYAEVTARLARMTQAATVEREHLTRLMGLWGAQAEYRLPERMPDLPKAARELPEVERTALAQRFDVRASVRDSELLASALGLTRATRYVDALELGYRRSRETGEPLKRGFELELHLPLFDWGEARTARAEHLYMQAVNRVAETAVNARSEARAAYLTYRTAYDVARHYRDEIVPLRKEISEEVLLRYNGMLMSVFELLTAAREQVAAVSGYIDALRDFWQADANLQMALTGGSPAVAALPMGAAPAASGGGGH